MKKEKKLNYEKGIMWFSRETERSICFYAAIVMLVLYGFTKFLGA